jgi:hypothetical protein
VVLHAKPHGERQEEQEETLARVVSIFSLIILLSAFTAQVLIERDAELLAGVHQPFNSF